VLKLIDVDRLSYLLHELSSIDGVLSNGEVTSNGYNCRYLSGLYGPCIFWGSILSDVPASISISHEYIAKGPKFEKAVVLFANHIIQEIASLDSQSDSVAAVSFKIEHPSKSGQDPFKKWTPGKIRKNNASFISALKGATTGRRKLLIECIIPIRTGSNIWKFSHVEKHVSLHFVQTGDSKTIVQTFNAIPLCCRMCGVFTNSDDSKAYYEIYRGKPGELINEYINILQTRVATSYLGGNLCRAMESLLCLQVIDQKVELLEDIRRMMHSSAGRMHGLIRWNRALHSVVEFCTHSGEFIRQPPLDKVLQQFRWYKIQTLNLFSSRDNSDILVLHRTVRQMLYEMSDKVSDRLLLDPTYTIKRLQALNFVCEALVATLERDVSVALADQSTNVDSSWTLIRELDIILKEAISSNSSALRGLAVDEVEAMESEQKANERARERMLVMSLPNVVADLKKRGKVPPEISREATLIKYLVDLRIDIVVQEVLQGIMLEGKLYPNPFPLIVTRFRAESTRHVVWTEKDTDLLARVCPPRLPLLRSHSRSGMVSMGKLNGLECTVRHCEEQDVIQLANSLSAIIPPTGGFQTDNHLGIYMCTSIGGGATLHSRISHCHHSEMIMLYETHVYDATDKAGPLESFGKNVLNQVLYLATQTQSQIVGLVTGAYAIDMLNENPGNDGGWRSIAAHEISNGNAEELLHPEYISGCCMDIHEIKQDYDDCKREIIRACKVKEPIVLRILTCIDISNGEKAYVLVDKLISLYTVLSPAGDITSYIPPFLQTEVAYQSVWLDVDQGVRVLDVISGYINQPDVDLNSSLHPAFRSQVRKLRYRTVVNVSKGFLYTAYRSMLRLCFLDTDKKHMIPNLARMMKPNTITFEISNSVDSTMVLIAALSERMESEYARKKLAAAVLKSKFKSFREHTENVISRNECVFLPGIRGKVHNFLVRIESDLELDRLGTMRGHIDKLYELRTYLECILVAASQAVHSNCPEISRCVDEFAEELLTSSDLSLFKDKSN